MTGNLPTDLNLPDSAQPRKVDFGTLAETVQHSLDNYFRDLDGEQPTDLYQLVIGEVERPLLKSLLAHTDNNQSKAARMLGINRATLRKKLKLYGLAN